MQHISETSGQGKEKTVKVSSMKQNEPEIGPYYN